MFRLRTMFTLSQPKIQSPQTVTKQAHTENTTLPHIYKYTCQRDICFLLSKVNNQSHLISNLSVMWTSSQVQKDIRITHLNHWPKKLNKQVYLLRKQCFFHIFLIGTGIDHCFRYRDSQEWQQSSPQSPKSLSHALCKSKKIFSQCLTCLVMMYHQTNFDCKSFSISEDLVETIVALTLNIAKYFWMLLWLMMMHHHTKFDWSEILSRQIFTEVQNLHCDLDLEYSKATFSQGTPAYEHALSN